MEVREVHKDLVGAVKRFLANREGFRDSNDWEGLALLRLRVIPMKTNRWFMERMTFPALA